MFRKVLIKLGVVTFCALLFFNTFAKSRRREG